MILVDTHILVWLASDESKLSKKARAAIEDARRTGDGLGVCAITLLELAILTGKGRLGFAANLQSFLAEVEARFTVLPITARACVRMLGLPAAFPKDPADRIIAATALVEGMSLVTADEKIRRSRALPTIWQSAENLNGAYLSEASIADDLSIVLPDLFGFLASVPSDESLGCLQTPSGRAHWGQPGFLNRLAEKRVVQTFRSAIIGSKIAPASAAEVVAPDTLLSST